MTTPLSRSLPADTALVLPVESFGLLGAGPEGRHALAQFGLTSTQFARDLTALRDRLLASGHAERLPLVEAIVLAGAEAVAWASIRSGDSTLPPTVAMIGPSWTLAASLHGEVAEWADGDHLMPARILASFPPGESGSSLTLFSGSEARIALRLRGVAVDIAVKDRELLSKAEAVAHRQGLADTWALLLDITCTSRDQ